MIGTKEAFRQCGIIVGRPANEDSKNRGLELTQKPVDTKAKMIAKKKAEL